MGYVVHLRIILFTAVQMIVTQNLFPYVVQI